MKITITSCLSLLFFTTLSCKENNSEKKVDNNFEKQSLDTLIVQKTLQYVSIPLECVGEQYAATKCYNKINKTKISFTKQSINLTFNNVAFENEQLNLPTELGYQTVLFDNSVDKIILIDFFLENGSMLYAYFYHGNKLKFLGKKEITFNEEENTKKFKVDQLDDEIIISISKNVQNINFNLSDAVN